MNKPLLLRPDSELAAQLRKDLTARRCVEEMLRSMEYISLSIGVKISWEVIEVEDIDVDRDKLAKSFGRLATAAGSLLAGGKVNPISVLDAHNPMKEGKQ